VIHISSTDWSTNLKFFDCGDNVIVFDSDSDMAEEIRLVSIAA